MMMMMMMKWTGMHVVGGGRGHLYGITADTGYLLSTRPQWTMGQPSDYRSTLCSLPRVEGQLSEPKKYAPSFHLDRRAVFIGRVFWYEFSEVFQSIRKYFVKLSECMLVFAK
jgi:hypothetical protein